MSPGQSAKEIFFEAFKLRFTGMLVGYMYFFFLQNVSKSKLCYFEFPHMEHWKPPARVHHLQAGQLYLRELRGMEASAKGQGMIKP